MARLYHQTCAELDRNPSARRGQASNSGALNGAELKLRLVVLELLGGWFWSRAFEDFFLDRRRGTGSTGAGDRTSRQGAIYEQETSQASQGHDKKRGANR